MNRALFLDRDGVINVDKGHIYKVEDFEFCSGILDLCRRFIEEGFIIVVITNQAGIAKGFYSVSDFYELDKWMIEQFEKSGINILRTYFCPHHPDFTGGCKCRKPGPGMLINAGKDLNIDLSKSIFIGDKESDIEAGIKAGIPSNILFTSQDVETKATMVIRHLNDLNVDLLKL